jgi:hypothetical protein
MTLTTRQLNHPPGDPVTHLDPYLTGYWPPGRLHRRTSFRLNGAASLVLPLGIRRWGGGGEDGGPLNGVARTVVEVGGLSGCLDPVTIGTHGGSRAEKKRRQRAGEIEDRLDHRCKCDGTRPACKG